MRQITRKKLIYKTGVEYGDYAINHVQGCAHNCGYCYARMMKRMNQDQWSNPAIVSNAVALLNEELPATEGRIKNIHMCFSTDPFMMHFPEVSYLTLQLLRRINEQRIPVTMLTKGIYPAAKLKDTLPANGYGITLVTLDEGFREKMEPGASRLADRLAALRKLHEMGKRTWISIEPYPTPNIVEQDIQELLQEMAFVDRIIFGRMNYSAIANAYPEVNVFYRKAASDVVRFCNDHGIEYHIKSGTVRDPVVTAGRGGGRYGRAGL